MGDRRDLQLSAFSFYIKRRVRVNVSFYFFAVAAVIALSDKSGMLLMGLLSAGLHEAGHLSAMLLLPGHAPTEISLTPFGLRIRSSPLAAFAKGNPVVLAAGSGVNLALAAFFYALSSLAPLFSRFPVFFNHSDFSFFSFSSSFSRFASLNLVMGAVNLLPVDSLDGGGLLRLLLRRFLSDRACDNVMTAVSLVTLTVMAFAGFTVLLRTRYNFTLLGMSLCLLFSLLLRLFSR